MKYFQVSFSVSPNEEPYCDILSALAGEIGFETFVPDDNGLTAYIQQRLFDEQALREVLDSFPIPGIDISYLLSEAEDKDWNEAWEEEGFEPIVVDTRLCIHDTRHPLPHPVAHDLLINPRQAFGTGTHPTTRTLLTTLLDLDLRSQHVVDAGCGTGVLGILCRMRGADRIFAYDIDEWSVTNTLDNVSLNGLTGFEVVEGDASVLASVHDVDLLIANIFREIIIADMPRFAATLRPQARMLLSGFYEQDVPAILDCAAQFGLQLQKQTICEGWAVLLLER